MKIVPIINMNKSNFKGSSGDTPLFKKITSKTAENLYNTSFLYSDETSNQDCFATFVWSKVSQRPVKVYVKPINIDEAYEEFEIYSSSDCNKASMIGLRYYDLDSESKHIIPGYMRALDNRFKGIGFRLHQLTFERMLMLGYKNIELISTVEAYPFHNCMGYTGSKESGILSLSKEAGCDWRKITNRQPILLGKFKI